MPPIEQGSAEIAAANLTGRKFAGRDVVVAFFQPEHFDAAEFDGAGAGAPGGGGGAAI